MPSVAALIVRAAARYVGVDRKRLVRHVARAASQARPAPARQPVATEPDRPLLVAVVFRVWLATVVLLVLVVLNVDLLFPRGVAGVFRLVVGLVLLLAAIGLFMRRLPFRAILTRRLTSRSGHGLGVGRTAHRHLVGAGLSLLACAFFVAGVLDALRGVRDLT
jgi:uncharacterized integral membrane protein